MDQSFKGQNGDSGRTRTPNLLIRSQLLYPVELRNHFDNATGCAGFHPICPDAFCPRRNTTAVKAPEHASKKKGISTMIATMTLDYVFDQWVQAPLRVKAKLSA